MISVLIPFGSDDPRRTRIFEWVYQRWELLMPEAQLCVGGDHSEEFNRGRARNNAFEASQGDIIVVADADVFTEPWNVDHAIGLLDRGAPWVVAHGTYYSLTEAASDRILQLPPAVDFSGFKGWTQVPKEEYHWRMVRKSCAGILVMSRESYEKAGGYPEDFIGWGYEDEAWKAKLNAAVGNYKRTDGTISHLWHDPGLNFAQPNIKHNENRLKEIEEGT